MLVKTAVTAAEKSYSPYSGYKVGAALLTHSGRVFTGCNIENSSFSATVCAERTAFFKAISEGESKFSAIAVAGLKDGKIYDNFTPCGVCRQVMTEFCDRKFTVLVALDENRFKEFTLEQLLPEAFNL